MRVATVFGSLALAACIAAPAAAATARIVVQDSPLAGARYYDAAAVWNELRRGDPLVLVREPGNPHDANAIRVEWKGRMLGYVPRRQNADLARQLDRGMAAEARVLDLAESRNGRRRMSYEIFVTLQQ
jgi:HIRAN domain